MEDASRAQASSKKRGHADIEKVVEQKRQDTGNKQVRNDRISGQQNEVGCICGRPDIGFMIGCDICCKWFHGVCVHISPEGAKNISAYLCTECTAEKEGKVPRTRDRNNNKKLKANEEDNKKKDPEDANYPSSADKSLIENGEGDIVKTDQNKVVLVRVMWLSSPYPMRCLVTLSHNDNSIEEKIYWSTPEFSVSYKNPEKYDASVQKPIERIREKPGDHMVGVRKKSRPSRRTASTKALTSAAATKPTITITTTQGAATVGNKGKKLNQNVPPGTPQRLKRKASLRTKEHLDLADLEGEEKDTSEEEVEVEEEDDEALDDPAEEISANKHDPIIIGDDFESSRIIHNGDGEDGNLSGHQRKRIQASNTIKRGVQAHDLEGRYVWPMQMKGNKISYWKQQKLLQENKTSKDPSSEEGERSDGDGESDEGSGDGWALREVFAGTEYWHYPTEKQSRQQRYREKHEKADMYLAIETDRAERRDDPQEKRRVEEEEEMSQQSAKTRQQPHVAMPAGGARHTMQTAMPAIYSAVPRPFGSHAADHFSPAHTGPHPHHITGSCNPAHLHSPRQTHRGALKAEDCTVVFFDEALQFRLVKGYTIYQLLCDACSVFDVSRKNMVLTDDKGRLWPPSSVVAEELAGAPSPVVYLRSISLAQRERGNQNFSDRSSCPGSVLRPPP